MLCGVLVPLDRFCALDADRFPLFCWNLQITKRYSHGGAVYGVSWSPFNKTMFATACHDNVVRVFDVVRDLAASLFLLCYWHGEHCCTRSLLDTCVGSLPRIVLLSVIPLLHCTVGLIADDVQAGSDMPVRALSGHSKRAFNVVWSPLLANVLASASDDRHVIVWDATSGSSKVRETNRSAAQPCIVKCWGPTRATPVQFVSINWIISFATTHLCRTCPSITA